MSLEQNHPFLKRENTGIQEKRKQLQRKEVIISAFGRHNCGKSTLLNFITRNLWVVNYLDWLSAPDLYIITHTITSF